MPRDTLTLTSDRRHFRRFELPQGQLKAEVGASGVDAAAAAFVRDISRGGVRLRTDRQVRSSDTEHCVVRFHDDGVTPSTTRGKICRTGADGGDFYVAIEFAQPLESLRLPRTTGA